jgi:putative intracellular protease/amidase
MNQLGIPDLRRCSRHRFRRALGSPDAVIAWVRKVTQTSDVTMSVCTGAFLLAKTGLLHGKSVATHHGAYAELAMAFPDMFVKRGARFVESGNIASSGGLSSGICRQAGLDRSASIVCGMRYGRRPIRLAKVQLPRAHLLFLHGLT